MTRPARNKPPFKPAPQPVKVKPQAAPPKGNARGAKPDARGARPDAAPGKAGKPARARRVALEPLTLTEKIFVRARPEKAYFAAIQPGTRAAWDKNLARARFVKPSKSEPAPTKAAPDAVVEMTFPMRLGGLFHMRYALIRQPQGFALEATRGSFGVLAGLAESWSFVPFKGGTEVTLTRSIVPRFRPFRAYAERQQRAGMKSSLEGLKKHVEESPK